jgi:hypothetical protein
MVPSLSFSEHLEVGRKPLGSPLSMARSATDLKGATTIRFEVVATATEPRAKPLIDLRAYSLLIVPVRLGLALAGLLGARLLGVDPGESLALFGLGAGLFFITMLAKSRPRSRFWQYVGEAKTFEPGTHVEAWPRTLARAAYPSTIGVSVLTAIALPIDARLAAVMAGLLGGMALGGLMFGVELAAWERSQSVRLFAAPGLQSKIFVRRSA